MGSSSGKWPDYASEVHVTQSAIYFRHMTCDIDIAIPPPAAFKHTRYEQAVW